ncbi:MAG: tyrosine-protein phosphatase [Planctomycetes bacterium]|nr:tyrosine-protein phosphatase [Planctomycetota bacterium]
MTRKGKAAILAGLAAAAAVVATAWHKWLRHEFTPRNFGVVESGTLFRSGQLTERMLRRVVGKHGLRTIVALNAGRSSGDMERRVAAELNVERFEFALPGDGRGDPRAVAQALAVMSDPQRQPVLVHCATGAQRTGLAVLLYRHLVQGVPIEEAYPESFGFDHRPEEWQMLAYVADHVEEIRQELDRIRSERK